jgi:hypothetical protein
MCTKGPGLDADGSAGVSDSAYFIESIELRPTFDLFLGAGKGLHFFGRASLREPLTVLCFCRRHRGPPSAMDYAVEAEQEAHAVEPAVECYRRRSCSEKMVEVAMRVLIAGGGVAALEAPDRNNDGNAPPCRSFGPEPSQQIDSPSRPTPPKAATSTRSQEWRSRTSDWSPLIRSAVPRPISTDESWSKGIRNHPVRPTRAGRGRRRRARACRWRSGQCRCARRRRTPADGCEHPGQTRLLLSLGEAIATDGPRGVSANAAAWARESIDLLRAERLAGPLGHETPRRRMRRSEQRAGIRAGGFGVVTGSRRCPPTME